MTPLERAKQWFERQLEQEQRELSRWKRLLLHQVRLYVFVAHEILSGEYMMRAGALVFATILALVPLGTVGFSLFRAFGGLTGERFDQIVEQKITDYLLGPLAPSSNRVPMAPPRGGHPAESTPSSSSAGPATAGEKPGLDVAGGRPPLGEEAANEAVRPPETARSEKDVAKEAAIEERRRIIENLSEQVTDTLRKLVRHASGARMSVFAVTILVISAVFLFHTIETAFNRIWHVERRRSILVKFPAFFTILTLGPLLIGLSIYLTRELNPGSYVSLSPFGQRLLARVTSVLMAATAFLIGYKLLPYTRVNWRPALGGALAAAIAWEAAKWGFGLYIQNTVHTRIYGSLAAFPIFLLWVYITWLIVLFGAGVSYTSQNLRDLAESERWARETGPVSERLMLAIMLVVAKRFLEGRGATTVNDLIESVEAPVDHLESAAAELVHAQLLASVAGDGLRVGYVPARPLDRIPVSEVLAEAWRANALTGRLRDDAERHCVEGLFDRMEAKRAEVSREVSVRNMVEDVPPEENAETGP